MHSSLRALLFLVLIAGIGLAIAAPHAAAQVTIFPISVTRCPAVPSGVRTVGNTHWFVLN